MQGFADKPHYTNVQMPFPSLPPVVPENNPTGLYERTFELPARWTGRRIVLHVGAAESVLIVRVNDREVGFSKDSHLAAEFDVTDHVKTGAEHRHAAGREVVRRHVRRGPGPVVARRHQPIGLPVRHRPHPAGRHPGGSRAGPGRQNRQPRPAGRRRLRERAAGSRMGRRGAAGGRQEALSCRGAHAGAARRARQLEPGEMGRPGAARGGAEAEQGPAGRVAGAARLAGAGAARRRWLEDRGPEGRALVARGAAPLRAPGDAALAARRGRGTGGPAGRVPQRRDPWPRSPAQRPAGLHPRRQSPRFQPAHGARRDARRDARRPRPDEAVRVQRGADLALPERPGLPGVDRRAGPVRHRRGGHRIARVLGHAVRRPALPGRVGRPRVADGAA